MINIDLSKLMQEHKRLSKDRAFPLFLFLLLPFLQLSPYQPGPTPPHRHSPSANHTMSYTMRCTLVVCVALALFAAGCNVEASKARPPRNNEIATMADAIKYLQDLDVYYGDRARVRFGKRGSLMQLLRSRMLESGNNNENINDNNNNNGELVS